MSSNTAIPENMKNEVESNFTLPDLTSGCLDPTTLKPKDLPEHFAQILKMIPTTFVKKDKTYPSHRILINGTRVSTFVAFSDGQKILIFDRFGGFDSTDVLNKFYDVFGAIQFENKSMFHCGDPKYNKIKSTDFAEVNIQKIESIPGLAVEVNEAKEGMQTVVTYGLYVEVTSEDLKLALLNDDNEQLMILDAHNLPKNIADNLTSKAQLAVNYIQKRGTAKR